MTSTEKAVTRTAAADPYPAGAWEFTADVANVFDDHVVAHLPHYAEFQESVAVLSDWLVPHGGIVADLGASTGRTAEMIQRRSPHREIVFHLYDEQPRMNVRARERLKAAGAARFQTHTADVITEPLAHGGANLTLALFTLQFHAARDRARILDAARRAAAEDGALLLAEKIRPADPLWAEVAAELTAEWKLAHGVTAEEVRAKARSIRGVLLPRRLADVEEELCCAGWARPEVLFRWHSWVLIGAHAR